MFSNTLNSLTLMLGLATLSRIAEAEEYPWHTYVRRPVLYPGVHLTTVDGPLNGTQCIDRCVEIPGCNMMITRPVEWQQFDELNKRADYNFVQKFRRTVLVECWLFAPLKEGGETNRWVARGVSVFSKGAWKKGDLLLVEMVFQDSKGQFDKNHISPDPLSDVLRYNDEDFRMELETLVPPVCGATPTISSAAPEIEGTSTSDDHKESTTSSEETTDPTINMESTSPPSTTESMNKPSRDTSNDVGFLSFSCRNAIQFGFTIKCADVAVNASEVLFALKPSKAEEGCQNLMPIRYYSVGRVLVNATSDSAEAYCSRYPCGLLTVPIGKRTVYVPSLEADSEIYSNVTTSPICYAYAVINYV